MTIRYQLLLTALAFAGALALFELTGLDLWVQHYFYNPETGLWMIPKSDRFYEHVLHRGMKKAIVYFDIAFALLTIASFFKTRFAPHRYRMLALLLSLILVPSLIGTLKHYTNTYCPNQVALYGGAMPYTKLTQPYPANFTPEKKGKCYPAGHATSGFGFMALFFFFIARRNRWLGLGFGLSLGWFMGVFQMMRGEHYLSHTVATMLLGWMMILIVQMIVRRIERRFPLSKGERP